MRIWLLSGGVPGEIVGRPNSRLAMLPGTTHVTHAERADWLLSMISGFLDAPIPEAERLTGSPDQEPDKQEEG